MKYTFNSQLVNFFFLCSRCLLFQRRKTLSIKFSDLNPQASQCLLAIHRFKLGADSVTYNQDYVDPNQQEALQEAPPTEE